MISLRNVLTGAAIAAAGLCVAPAVQAFCGFFVSGADSALYNDASQVVLMRKGNRTVMSMSNNYKGPTEDFAMVVPVPVILQEQQVKTLPADVFSRIDQLSAPRLVEYWEQDPCWVEPEYAPVAMMATRGGGPMLEAPTDSADDLGVRIEAKFEVGEYQILILSAKEATGLDTWLRQNKYQIPSGASEALAPYIQQGMKFFVAKVDIKKVKRDASGAVVLSPLRFDYESADLRLPVRLGLLNAQGKQDLLIYVLNPESRFEAANYRNIFIPSNVEVEDAVRKQFGAFYVQLFDAALAKVDGKAIVTEYAWQTDSCDPCPVPPLTPEDLFTLGGDVFNEGSAGTPGGPKGPTVDRNTPYFGPASSWVLTRMHTRYSKETLSEDIVFTPAKPVRGGRSEGMGRSAEQPGSVEMAASNNFQGRYIIRHYWEGPIACKTPVFDRWGGPPNGLSPTTAATDLANAPRGAVALGDVVTSALPQLQLAGKPAPARKGGTSPAPAAP